MYTKKTFKIKSIRTDWGKFQEYLDSKHCNFFTADSEEQYKLLIETITNGIKYCTPKRNVNVNNTHQLRTQSLGGILTAIELRD